MAVNPSEAVANWLRASVAVNTMTGPRVWADVEREEGYRPSHGPSLLIHVRHGTQPYRMIPGIMRASIVCEATAASLPVARDLDQAVRAQFTFGLPNAPLSTAEPESVGLETREPDTRWPVVISAYEVTYRDT